MYKKGRTKISTKGSEVLNPQPMGTSIPQEVPVGPSGVPSILNPNGNVFVPRAPVHLISSSHQTNAINHGSKPQTIATTQAQGQGYPADITQSQVSSFNNNSSLDLPSPHPSQLCTSIHYQHGASY